MRHCNLHSCVGEYISEGLIKNRVLRELHLSNNSLCDAGVIALSSNINNILEVITLRNNRIEEAGGLQFLKNISYARYAQFTT